MVNNIGTDMLTPNDIYTYVPRTWHLIIIVYANVPTMSTSGNQDMQNKISLQAKLSTMAG